MELDLFTCGLSKAC